MNGGGASHITAKGYEELMLPKTMYTIHYKHSYNEHQIFLH